MGRRTNTAKWMDNQGRWQINVQKDGRRRSFTSSTPGRTGQREANAKADAWLDDGIDPQGMRVKGLLEQWLADKKASTSRGNSEAMEYRVNKWILPTLGHRKIDSLTEQDLQDILNAALQEGLSKKSIANILADMRSFLRYCRRRRVTSFDPEDVSIPKGARSKPKEVLQPDALKMLFTTDTMLRYGKPILDDYIHAYRLQVVTGLRPGEIRGLTWDDVDFKRGLLYVRRSINRYDETTQGKNENAIRCFALNSLSTGILRRQRALFLPGTNVFPITSTANYWARLKRYCESNELAAISPYELRHTFVSAVKNLPEGQIKALVGHSRDMDTFGIYGHDYDGDQTKTGAAVEGVFQKILESVL